MNSKEIIEFIRDHYKTKNVIPLHEPSFVNKEKNIVSDAVSSTYVSSIGKYIGKFEDLIQCYTKSKYTVATVNCTSAIHTALFLCNVKPGDIVLTQALTFVATCNAIKYLGAEPVFCDISEKGLGLCPIATEEFLNMNAFISNGQCKLKKTKQVIKAMLPVHTFGHPVEIGKLIKLAKKWHISVVEDAAESLGSLYKGKHTGTFGKFGTVSFNGNKIITTGGGGMILCRNRKDYNEAKHITTTAKVDHDYKLYHDKLGFNYRMPNINAALGCAQMKSLTKFIKIKRDHAKLYEYFFSNSQYSFVKEPDYSKSNYWLNAIMCPDEKSRNILLRETNKSGIKTRPAWTLMYKLPHFKNCKRGKTNISEKVEKLLINLPSSPKL